MLNRLIKKLLPIAAMGLAVTGCDGMDISISGSEGVPLAELDTSGPAPTGIVIAGADTVVITEGETLSIDVEGDQDIVDSMRFTLEDETLGIMREQNSWERDGTAIVRVTMPLPKKVVVAGSGKVDLPGLGNKAEVTIAGSGSAMAGNIAVDSLDLTIAGSGDFETAGTARRLDLTIAGSGTAKMAGLQVEAAEIAVAGSGDAQFASDGTVEANVAGSGNITVTGSATCTIKSMGSGSLTCKAAEAAAGPSADHSAGDGGGDEATES